MSGFNISIEDRLACKGLPRKKIIETLLVMTCVKKCYEQGEAESELWSLQREFGHKWRWVIEFCEPCDAFHIVRLSW